MSSRDFHWRFFSRSAAAARREEGIKRLWACAAGVLEHRGQRTGAGVANLVHFKDHTGVSSLTNELEHLGVVLLERHVAGLQCEKKEARIVTRPGMSHKRRFAGGGR